MKPGDLVKFIKPTSTQINKVFLIIEGEETGNWYKISETQPSLFHHRKDFIVVNSA